MLPMWLGVDQAGAAVLADRLGLGSGSGVPFAPVRKDARAAAECRRHRVRTDEAYQTIGSACRRDFLCSPINRLRVATQSLSATPARLSEQTFV